MTTRGRTRVKVCGITDETAALAAADAGADALGFVFHPPSPRNIDPEDAWDIIGLLPPMVSSVGVFVNASIQRFADAEQLCPTDLSQLHGDEPIDTVRQCGPNVIKAVRFDPATIAADLARWDAVEDIGAILVDGSAGGRGESFDWSLLQPHARALSKPLIVAGGLTPANVGDAIRALRPFAVDVSSGVESSPGRKELSLIRDFCAAVRQADNLP